MASKKIKSVRFEPSEVDKGGMSKIIVDYFADERSTITLSPGDVVSPESFEVAAKPEGGEPVEREVEALEVGNHTILVELAGYKKSARLHVK
ncbi:MAG: hypothetical protein AB1Z98_16470 [Nannocystaceae bacterium]